MLSIKLLTRENNMKLSKRQTEELVSLHFCGEPTYRPGQCKAIQSLMRLGLTEKDGLNNKGHKLAKSLIVYK